MLGRTCPPSGGNAIRPFVLGSSDESFDTRIRRPAEQTAEVSSSQKQPNAQLIQFRHGFLGAKITVLSLNARGSRKSMIEARISTWYTEW